MSSDSLIHVQELCKHFRSFHRREGVRGAIQNLFVRDYRTVAAVDRVSFSIGRGEMVGYIGPNGAGKSTSIKMLTGILVPSSGEVVINGFVPFRQRRHYVRTIGVVFGQRTQLWWDIAVIESFKLLRRIYDVSQRDFDERMERFDEILGIRDYCTRRCVSFPWASACAATWPPRCCTIRRCCSSMSPPLASTW
jgi:viologen exporter family transport system ATP-binding protein